MNCVGNHDEPVEAERGLERCVTEDCMAAVLARGLCRRHYSRAHKRGELDRYPRMNSAQRHSRLLKPSTVIERFLTRFVRGPGCWIWQGTILSTGYGQITDGPRGRLLAHRLSYEYFVGPIPEGLTIDHLCRNQSCVNPAHLEPVTPGENSRRALGGVSAINRAKRSCPRCEGEFTRLPNGDRGCRPCMNARQQERRARRSAG